MSGLLESGGVKEEPLWFAVMKKIPPPFEANASRPLPPQNPIPEIVYEEDYARAKKQLPPEYKSTSKVTTNDSN